MTTDGPPGVYDRLTADLKSAGRFLLRNAWTIGTVLAVVALVFAVWDPIRSQTHRTVILYTGTPSADSSRMGESIHKHFKMNGPDGLVTYHVELRPSEGLGENRRRVAEASDGALVLGFDQDGFEPPESVRTLIPLTELFLHLVANDKETASAMEWSKSPPIRKDKKKRAFGPYENVPTLRLLLDYWDHLREEEEGKKAELTDKKASRRPQTFYLGPRGSGSRQLAERVLKHYGKSIDAVDYGDHIDWLTAYRLLATGDIDLIFDASDLGSGSLAEQARKDRYTLIGLDDVDGLVASYPFCRKQAIPKGAYSAEFPFCRANLNTVTTQKLVVCNQAMSAYDVYHLTTGIREAVRQSVPTVRWDKEELRPGTGLVCPLHPGVDDYRHGRKPLGWASELVAKYSVAAIPFALGFLVWLTRRLLTRRAALAQQSTATPPPSEPPTPPAAPPGPPPQPAPIVTPPAPATPPTSDGFGSGGGRPAAPEPEFTRSARFDRDFGVGPAAALPKADRELLQLQVRCEYLHDELDHPVRGPTLTFFQEWKQRYDDLIQDTLTHRLLLGHAHGAEFEELFQNLRKLQLDYAQARSQAKVVRKVRAAENARET